MDDGWSVGFIIGCVLAACGQSPGLVNPSFEEGAVNTSWPLDWNLFGAATGTRQAGTGFVPTDGAYFLDLMTTSSMTGIRDDVDLSSSSALLFDYEAIGTVPDAATATVEILFTATGTTLWSRAYPTGTVGEQMLEETVVLDMLGNAGRFTIQVTTDSGANLDSRIDNLRME